MDFTRLRIFGAVAEHGSFAAAADALDYTPSAVSQQMARLEAEVGLQLVSRTGRGTTLTPAGERLLPHARDILERVARARHDLDVLRGTAVDRLGVGAFATAATAFVAAALREVRSRHEDMSAMLVEREPFEAVADLRAGRIDVAVVYQRDGHDLGQDFLGKRVADPAGLTVQRLLTEPYLLAIPPDHPLAARTVIEPAALDGVPMIGSALWPGVGTLVTRLAEHGAEPRFDNLISESYTTVLPLVAAGEGLALVPQLAAWRADTRVVLRSLGDVGPVRHIDLVSVPGRDFPALEELTRLIVSSASRLSSRLADWRRETLVAAA